MPIPARLENAGSNTRLQQIAFSLPLSTSKVSKVSKVSGVLARFAAH